MSEESLRREFILRTADDAKAMFAFVKSNAAAFSDRGTPLWVTIQEDEPDRLAYQIKYFFGVCLKTISENIWIEGKRFDKDTWHVYLAQRFLPGKEIVLPDGTTQMRRASIARGHIGQRAMANFTKEVEAWAASEHGIVFPERQQ